MSANKDLEIGSHISWITVGSKTILFSVFLTNEKTLFDDPENLLFKVFYTSVIPGKNYLNIKCHEAIQRDFSDN